MYIHIYMYLLYVCTSPLASFSVLEYYGWILLLLNSVNGRIHVHKYMYVLLQHHSRLTGRRLTQQVVPNAHRGAVVGQSGEPRGSVRTAQSSSIQERTSARGASHEFIKKKKIIYILRTHSRICILRSIGLLLGVSPGLPIHFVGVIWRPEQYISSVADRKSLRTNCIHKVCRRFEHKFKLDSTITYSSKRVIQRSGGGVGGIVAIAVNHHR